MKRALALLQFNRHWFELNFVFFAEYAFNRAHVVRQSGDWQETPAVTARHVMNTAVRARRIVQTDPARQMRHRLGPRPIGIILVPSYDSAVMRGFAEKLVMPEAYGA